MITTAITGAIAGALTYLGVEPGPYIGGVWIGVKVTLVGSVALIMWLRERKKSK